MLFPEFSHFEMHHDLPIFVTTEGVAGVVYRLPVVDLEGFGLQSQLGALERLTKAISPELLLRVKTSYSSQDALSYENTRADIVETHGYLVQTIYLLFEIHPSGIVEKWRGRTGGGKRLVELLPREELQLLGARPCSHEEIHGLFIDPYQDIVRHSNCLDVGETVTGVLRLYKQGTNDISEETLASLLNEIPLPFSVNATIRKIPSSTTEYRMRSRLARQSISADPTDARRMEDTAAALEKTGLDGADQFSVEWLLTLPRRSEAELRTDYSSALSALKPLGELMVETVGCLPSYRATLPGSTQHFTFLEYDQATVLFLPIFSFGESQVIQSPPSRALLLHRQDGSLHLFDQFSSSFLAYNAIISGKSGSGKSVLANTLSEALLSDPNIHMVKIDVGGSYRKECALFGGKEISFSLDKPSGVNPFRFLDTVLKSNDAVDTLTKWLAALLREENEQSIPRSLMVQLSAIVKTYSLSSRANPSMDDFFNFSSDFPRKEFLSRWCQGGVFENAFLGTTETTETNFPRYRYYNFESIQNAANPDFAEGVMAAVIAEINLEMIRLGKAEEGGKRLILFCDETKFFIDRNAQFFLLTTANFRKFGHGVILITQNTRNFDLPTSGERVDSGIILNSPIRFIFEQDVEREYLKSTFSLSDHQLQTIIDSPYRGSSYREFVLQDDTGTRLVRLYLTPQKYWKVSSTREDNDKLALLQKHVPGLTLDEAISCLAK
jgi:hypothetical protein